MVCVAGTYLLLPLLFRVEMLELLFDVSISATFANELSITFQCSLLVVHFNLHQIVVSLCFCPLLVLKMLDQILVAAHIETI